MPQQTLQTERIILVPLADEHLEWEVELDSDFEVMRYLSGRASTREEVAASHARRIAAAQKVDGLGIWVGLADDEFVGWWILQPAHGPDQPDDPGVADVAARAERTQAVQLVTSAQLARDDVIDLDGRRSARAAEAPEHLEPHSPPGGEPCRRAEATNGAERQLPAVYGPDNVPALRRRPASGICNTRFRWFASSWERSGGVDRDKS